jgi:hypothetical protein
MADDVWTALVKGVLAFGQTRAADLVQTSFKDSGSFLSSLKDGVNDQNTKDAFDKLKADAKAIGTEGKALADALTPDIKKAADAVKAMATDIGANPFDFGAAARVASDIADILIAFDSALDKAASTVSHKGKPDSKPAVYDAIYGIDAPYKGVFNNMAADAGKVLDTIAKQLLGTDGATKKLGQALKLDRAGKELTMELASTGVRTIVPGFDAFQLQDTHLIAFFTYKAKAAVGVRVKTKLKAGLRSDKLLQKVIPNGAPSSDTDYTTISLDSDKGLTFGDGKNKTLMLPVSFSFPAVELREFAISLPDTKGAGDEIDVSATLAAKIGDVVGFVVEGSGVKIHVSAAGAVTIEAKHPDAIGVRINASVVTGGGYIYLKDNEYGGILDLQFLKIGITVICIVATDPFSLVVILAVRFTPKIELSFGFTLNGIGGLLALERRASTDELRKGIHDGTADTVLFPSDPINEAPKILDKVRTIFPPQGGAFVVGPIALLGWGSQAGFVVAKVGIILCLPDPKLILLGAISIGVPSADFKGPRIVDLHAEVYGEFAPEYLLLLVGLTNSKIATISISGDIGLLIRWAGGANFALSVGGFHPRYTPPPELAGMRRITIEMSPPSPILKLHLEGYFAITANSLQVGGKISLHADVGAASADAWLALNALFVWSPYFYFEADIDVGITIKVFGFTICGARFQGSLEGTTPFRAQGTATIDLGFFGSYDFHLGPITWGDPAPTLAPSVSPRTIVADALSEVASWTPRLPAGGDMLIRLIADSTPLLLHPLGMLEVKQQKVPLETRIDRIGSNPVDAHMVNLSAPMINKADAAAVSQSQELFAPGHFVNLTADQQVSQPDFESFPAGMKLVASRAAAHGTAMGAEFGWNTCFPQEGLATIRMRTKFVGLERGVLRLGAVSRAAREHTNSYEIEKPEKIAISDQGIVSLRRRDDLAVVPGTPATMTSTAAFQMRLDLESKGAGDLELVALGVLK